MGDHLDDLVAAERDLSLLAEENTQLEAEVERLKAQIKAALAILGEPVTPGDYGSFLLVRDQVTRAVEALTDDHLMRAGFGDELDPFGDELDPDDLVEILTDGRE